MLLSYTICTGIAIALGLTISGIILGIVLSTRWYSRWIMKNVERLMLSEEYTVLIKKVGKKTIEVAISSIGEMNIDDYSLSIEKR